MELFCIDRPTYFIGMCGGFGGEYATALSRAVLLGDPSKNQDFPRALYTRKKLHCKRRFHGFQKGSVALV